MFFVYLFATIVGGALLGTSLVAGDHHGSDHAGHGGDGDASALNLFSLRLWTYLLFFFGATGLLLRLAAGVAPLFTALVAGGVGVTAALGASVAIRRALAAGKGGTVVDSELVGRSAEVLVPLAKGTTGRVRLLVKNSTIDLYAVCEEGAIGAKDEVLIVEMKADGVALVTRNPAARHLPDKS